MKILIIQQKMIGDVLTSSIICNNLKLTYPDSKIDYLIYPFTFPVIENNPNIDEVLFFEQRFRTNKLALFSFLQHIKRQNYDIVIDVYGKIESHLIVAFSGAKTKIGFYKWFTNFLYSQTVQEIFEPKNNFGTAIENRLNLIKSLVNQEQLEPKPRLFLTDSEIKNGKSILKRVNLSKKTYMISLLGSGSNKTYPLVYMAKLLDFIVAQSDANLIFNYIPSQEKDAQSIFASCSPQTQKNLKIEIAPKTIREFLSVTYHCHALIGNEGGAINMAKALNKPTFSIFSTWINKEAWSCFEDESSTISVHLKDFKPELYGNKSAKEMKKQALYLYDSFVPDLIFPKLKEFLNLN